MATQRSHSGRCSSRRLSWANPEEILSSPGFVEFRQFLPALQVKAWNDPQVRNRNIALVRRHSSLGMEVINNKGGWLFPEKVYRADPMYLTVAPEHNDDLDRFIIRQPMCHSLATRFEFISQTLLPTYISKVLARAERVKIGSLGSGAGRDVMIAMNQFEQNATADLYDLDSAAISEGRKVARHMHLEQRIECIHQDFTRLRSRCYDILLLVGIICPLPDMLAQRIMRTIRHCLASQGFLIVSAPSNRMRSKDPLSRFLLEYFAGLYLQFRDDERMGQLAKSSGYDVVEVVHEPLGYHKVLVATRG